MEEQLVKHVNAIKRLIKQMDEGRMHDLYSELLIELEKDPTVKQSIRSAELKELTDDPFNAKERRMLDELSAKIKELRRVLGDKED